MRKISWITKLGVFGTGLVLGVTTFAGSRTHEHGLHPKQENSRALSFSVQQLVKEFKSKSEDYSVAKSKIKRLEADRKVVLLDEIIRLEDEMKLVRSEALKLEKKLRMQLALAVRDRVYSESVCSLLDDYRVDLLNPIHHGGLILAQDAMAPYQVLMCQESGPDSLMLGQKRDQRKGSRSTAAADEIFLPGRSKTPELTVQNRESGFMSSSGD